MRSEPKREVHGWVSANSPRASETLALGLCFCPLTLQQLRESEAALGGVCNPHFPSGVPGGAQALPKPWQGAVAQPGFCAEGGGAARPCVTAPGIRALQPCSRGEQADRSGRNRTHPVKQEGGEFLLVVPEVRSRGMCCWAQHQLLARPQRWLARRALVFKGDVLRGERWQVAFVSLPSLASEKCLLC